MTEAILRLVNVTGIRKKPRLVCVTSVDIRNKESGERLWMKIF